MALPECNNTHSYASSREDIFIIEIATAEFLKKTPLFSKKAGLLFENVREWRQKLMRCRC
jgi:hypothetical protein